MREICLGAVLLLTLFAAAQADSCKNIFNGFADDTTSLPPPTTR